MNTTVDDCVTAMKREADEIASKGRCVSWRDGGPDLALVNCRRTNGGYEWRSVTTASGPGKVISEATARQHLEQFSDIARRPACRLSPA